MVRHARPVSEASKRARVTPHRVSSPADRRSRRAIARHGKDSVRRKRLPTSLPATALDAAVLTRSPNSIADMNGVDWTVGGIEMAVDGPVTVCGRMAGFTCGYTNDPPGATLTIAPPVAGGTAFTTQYVDVNPYRASYLMAMTGTFQHMGLVSAGRFEVTPGSKLNDTRPNCFKLQMLDVTWLHHGVIEVNLGGGAGMLELRNSTLGNIGIAPNLTVGHKRASCHA